MVTAEVARLLQPGSGSGGAASELAAEQEARFVAWEEALDALVAPSSAVWLIEDVHWAGPDVLAFIRGASHSDRLIVCTARPSIRESATGWLEAGDILDLGTLPANDASELIRALIGDALPDPLVAAIAERSDGNPLFIEELLRAWVSVGSLAREADGWRLTLEPEAVTLPPTVQAIYAAQLDDLPGDARLVARRASVAGRRFADAALGPLGLEDRRGGLDVLRRRALVAGPQPDSFSGDVYAFRHALLRDAGYASLARAERATLHAALARWLEEAAGTRRDEVAQLIAEHYAAALASLPALGSSDRSGLRATAATWYERGAAFAMEMAAPAEAIRLLDRAVELTDSDATVDLARRRLSRGRVTSSAADLAAGIADMRAALESLEAELPASHALYAEAAYALGLALMQQIGFDDAASLTDRARRLLDGLDEPAGRARLMALHAWAVAAGGGRDGVMEEADRARGIVASLDEPSVELDVLEHWATVNDEVGDSGEPVWFDLAARARSLGRWRQVVTASRFAAMTHMDQAPGEAIAMLDEAADVARSHGLTEAGGWVDLGRAEAALVIGDWDAGLGSADRALSLAERYSYERLAFRTWMIVLPILAARRDPSWLPRYAAWWAVAREHFPAEPSPYGRVLRAATEVWLARARGEPDPLPADPELPAILVSNPHFLAARETLAESLAAGGKHDRAAALLADGPDADWTPLMNASYALMRARIAHARGEPDHGAIAAEAAEHARSIGAAWWEARALAPHGSTPGGRSHPPHAGRGSAAVVVVEPVTPRAGCSPAELTANIGLLRGRGDQLAAISSQVGAHFGRSVAVSSTPRQPAASARPPTTSPAGRVRLPASATLPVNSGRTTDAVCRLWDGEPPRQQVLRSVRRPAVGELPDLR